MKATKLRTRTEPYRPSRAAAKCLAGLLDAELGGTPAEIHVWRARNAKKIPLVDELRQKRALDGHTHYTVTFWGLLNTPGVAAKGTLSNCERVFKALRKYFPDHPKNPIAIVDLAKQVKLTPTEVFKVARFLERSPLMLAIHGEGTDARASPNENYVRVKNFDEVKDKTRKEVVQVMSATAPNLLLFGSSQPELAWPLAACESEAVRECWRKAVERVSTDPAGAITASRSLLEAGCKHVFDEYAHEVDPQMDLPKLYKQATALLRFDQHQDIDESLRRVVMGGATVVDGLARLRNKLGDAHGKSIHSPKPAKRHAQFAVMIAGAVTVFLMETLDAQRTP